MKLQYKKLAAITIACPIIFKNIPTNYYYGVDALLKSAALNMVNVEMYTMANYPLYLFFDHPSIKLFDLPYCLCLNLLLLNQRTILEYYKLMSRKSKKVF